MVKTGMSGVLPGGLTPVTSFVGGNGPLVLIPPLADSRFRGVGASGIVDGEAANTYEDDSSPKQLGRTAALRFGNCLSSVPAPCGIDHMIKG